MTNTTECGGSEDLHLDNQDPLSEGPESAVAALLNSTASADWWVGTDPLLGSITLVITIMAVLGNATAIYYISTSAALRTPSFLVLLMLAIVDLSTGTLHLPFVTLACFSGTWLGEPMLPVDRDVSLTRCKCTFLVEATRNWCRVSSYIRPFTQPVSFVTVVIISLLRFLSLHFPLTYRVIATTQRVVAWTLIAWIVTILMTIPTAIYVKGYNYNLVAKQCMWNFAKPEHVKFGFAYTMCFLAILVAVLISLVTGIVIGLAKQQQFKNKNNIVGSLGRENNDTNPSKGHSSINKLQKSRTDYKHASLISILIAVIFMVSIGPFYVFGLIRSYTRLHDKLGKNTLMSLRTLTFWMLYLSPVVNPLLYVLRLPKVRTELKEQSKRGIKQSRQGFQALKQSLHETKLSLVKKSSVHTLRITTFRVNKDL